MGKMDKRELQIVEYSVEAYLKLFSELLNKGKKNFLFHGIDKDSIEFLNQANKYRQVRPCNFFGVSKGQEFSRIDGIEYNFDIKNIDAIFVFVKDASKLSQILANYYNMANCLIVAPITEHYYAKRSLFIQSIPKSGTHLMFECAKALGFHQPQSLDLPGYNDPLLPGYFYNLQHMTDDYLSLPYPKISSFIDSICSAVIVFIYRDPRDIAVSLYNYLVSQNEYHILHGFLKALPMEKGLSSVINGLYPIPIHINRNFNFSGTIRDLLMNYINWFQHKFSNVVCIKFEDIVGYKGGGDDAIQLDTVWKLQLCLHVSGKPADFAGKIFSKKALTFRKGQIGGYLEEFTEEHAKIFKDLPQDFMDIYGYTVKIKVNKPFVVWLDGMQYPDRSAIAKALRKEFIFIASEELIIFDIDESTTMIKAAKILENKTLLCINSILPYDNFRGKVRKFSQEMSNVIRVCLQRGKQEIKQRDIVIDPACGLKKTVGFIIGALIKQGYITILQSPHTCAVSLEYFSGSILCEKFTPHPILVKEGYRGFNIVQYKNCYYAINQRLGKIDFPEITDNVINEYKKLGQCFVGKTIDAVNDLVDGFENSSALINSVKKELHENLNNLNASMDVFKQDIDEKGKAIDASNKQIEDSRSSIDRLNQGLENSSALINSAKKEFMEKLNNLNTSMEVFKQDIDEKGKAIDASNKQIEDSRSSIDRLNKGLEDSGTLINSAKKEFMEKLNNLNTSMDVFKQDIDEKGKAIDISNKQIEDSEKKIYFLKQELENMQKTKLYRLFLFLNRLMRG